MQETNLSYTKVLNIGYRDRIEFSYRIVDIRKYIRNISGIRAYIER